MSYILTAEEFILSLLLIDGAAAASSIKDEVFGEISEKELECRLDSATSGLLTKNLLSIQHDQEALNDNFQQFLLGLTNVPRVLRCQIATDTGLITTSLYCGTDYTIQQSLYDNRVYKLFKEENEREITRYMDMAYSNMNGKSFTIKEEVFENVIDKLLQNKELTQEESAQFAPEFLRILKGKQGKLNSLYDYRLGHEQIAIGSFLYITDANQTWMIENNGEILHIQPFSFHTLF